MSEIIELTVTNGQPTTTSLAIAEHFGKRHADVLRSIENLECSKEYYQRNFALVTHKYVNGKGGVQTGPAYEVTKDGFMFLAMGFTGKEAAAWKERFITAFNAMERQLLENASAQQIPQPSAQLFLSHTADIIVAADRTFRAGVRTGRQAG
jgi:Rha family phage regulatory protein